MFLSPVCVLSVPLRLKGQGTLFNFGGQTGKDSYSTVGCQRTGGRRFQPGSLLFFTTPANLVLIFQSVFESRRLACSAQTVLWRRMPGGECGWNVSNRRSGNISKSAMPPKKSSSQQTLFACGETVLKWNSSLAVLRQTVLRHPTVLLGGCLFTWVRGCCVWRCTTPPSWAHSVKSRWSSGTKHATFRSESAALTTTRPHTSRREFDQGDDRILLVKLRVTENKSQHVIVYQ